MGLPDFKKLFTYNPDLGKLFWRVARGSAGVGTEAGTFVSGGYRRVLIEKKSYAIHHIVWWWERGVWPTELDHIDMRKSNNHISNLREVTRSENMLNRLPQFNNTSGVKGVHQHFDGSWKVQLRRKGKAPIRKTCKTYEEAILTKQALEFEFYGPIYRSKY